MTTITLEKPKLSKTQETLVQNAFAVLAHADSGKAKRQEAIGVLTSFGIKTDMAPVAKAKGPSTKSGVLQDALDKEAARKAEIGKAVKAQKVKTLAEEKAEAKEADTIVNPDAPPIVQALQAAAEAGCLKELVNAVFPPETTAVTEDELKTALAIIERATKQQVEVIRKAAAERKKIAPVGEKVKPVKELTDAQKAKLAKAEKAAETYSVVCSAAKGLAGKGLGESTKMQTALSFVPLPALRWLAKQFEGVAIPKEKRSAADIREFLRVELLTYSKPYQFGDLAKMELKA